MSIITSIICKDKDLDDQFVQEDVVLLTSEERISAHFLAKSIGGRKLKLSFFCSRKVFLCKFKLE